MKKPVVYLPRKAASVGDTISLTCDVTSGPLCSHIAGGLAF